MPLAPVDWVRKRVSNFAPSWPKVKLRFEESLERGFKYNARLATDLDPLFLMVIAPVVAFQLDVRSHNFHGIGSADQFRFGF